MGSVRARAYRRITASEGTRDMQYTSSSTARQSSFSGDVRIVERSRGTAHPQTVPTRERVARSLLLRPDVQAERYVRR
jgi:hypothetical protein